LLHQLPASPAQWVKGGPLAPRNMLVIGSWWMMRETELANTRALLAKVTAHGGTIGELTLPATKTDAQALGATSAHGCTCGLGSPRADCPAHALWDQLLFLTKRFPSRFRQGVPDASLPLFPTAAGTPASKEAMTATIVEGARLLGCPLRNTDASARVSGHSLRPTGAQGLARLGVDAWSIQLIGRWGSSTVMTYIREAAVDAAAARARATVVQHSLPDMLQSLRGAAPTAAPAEVTEARVKQILDDWGCAAQNSWRSSLLEELRDAALTRAPASPTSSSSESSTSTRDSTPAPSPPCLLPDRVTHVKSNTTRGGLKHRVVVGPPSLPTSGWITACGWRFGHAGAAAQEAGAEDRPCMKCLRAEGAVRGPPRAAHAARAPPADIQTIT